MYNQRFATYAWVVLAFTLLVILWGAYVRATGSGAGCGSHWPLCNGEVLPEIAHQSTFIEFFHRISSGIALLLVIGILVWCRRAYPSGSPMRTAGWAALIFIIIEALLGAALVVFELVGDDSSLVRAGWMAVHLTNTLLLLLPLTLLAWWSSGGKPFHRQPMSLVAVALFGALASMLLLSASGGIAALGDTLFPAASLEASQQDSDEAAHVLIRLRIFHPALAILAGIYLAGVIWLVWQRVGTKEVQKLAALTVFLFCLELIVGAINVLLLAPVALQLIHLLLATLVWISLVLLTAETLAQPVRSPSFQNSPARQQKRDPELDMG